MSHLKERAEKICLNCNATLQGRFCHVCGQENIEPKESFRHLLTHFVYDIVHFDGKFFSTVKYLLFKPGFLSKEHLRGRRVSYLHPIRMYIFVSAFFFLIFLSFFKPDVNFGSNDGDDISQSSSAEVIKKYLADEKKALEAAAGVAAMPEKARAKLQRKINRLDHDIALMQKDTLHKSELLTIGDVAYAAKFNTREAYDSAQRSLPESKRDSWLERHVEYKNIEYRNKYGNSATANEMLTERFFHSFPQLLFMSLPIVALLLQLLYIRRKQFYYVNHLIFTLHLYCAIFVILFYLMLLSLTHSVSWLGWVSWLEGLLWLGIVGYTLVAMHNFYGQGWMKTFMKMSLLGFATLFVIVFLFCFFFFLSILMH